MTAEIFRLIDQGDAEGVRRLLDDDPSAAAARDEQGLSAIVRSAYTSPELLEAVLAADPPRDGWDTLLTGGTDPLPDADAWSPDGFTALHLSAFANNVEAARLLLDRGADPNVVARASFASVTPLGTAAFAGSVAIARLLLERGADPNRTGEGGGGPLHTAAANGNRELVELLLAHGADPRVTTDDGRDAAHLAAEQGHDELAALLRERAS